MLIAFISEGREILKKSVLIFILLLISMVVLSPATSSPTTALSVNPPTIIDETKVAGTTFTINITVTEVIDLLTFDFRLNYSTAVLTVTEITLGSFFPENSVVWKEEIDDTVGSVRYLVSMPFGTPQGGGMNGSGTLATINFTVDSYGESSLDLCNTKLSDSYGSPIPHEVYDGYFSNKILGDVDGDGDVDASDLSDLNKAYGSKPGKPNWDSDCDFNRDNKVEASDLFDLSKNYGRSI